MSDDLFPGKTSGEPFDESQGPKSYAVGGKIMLSAILVLFTVVILMICLHVYARWYIRRVRRLHRRDRRRTHLVFYVESDSPGSIVGVDTRGLEDSVIKSLPTFTYHSSELQDGDEKPPPECAVCLSEFEEGEKGRILPKCNHSFHVGCIDMWFHSHSTCPLCRSPVDGNFPAAKPNSDPADVVVEIDELTGTDPARSFEFCADCQNEAGEGRREQISQPQSSAEMDFPSIWARRKTVELVGVSIEVPRRVESFNNLAELGPRSPASHEFKSPTSRILSFKRILSRGKRPLPSPSGIGTSCSTESDTELRRAETPPSRTRTPR
ncbi:hypothetical protein Nepgr_031152 [Nepenthes gracilis]|uniref:RING-type E3 ubiquitin transferase n=1 Tax=Nepenthes gracilis TaxID=150966 RepID=A0AAD3Y6S5_NEPGR|nr:hypothetical protein Nepgr_031152 [Nepenthes gracilis]